MLVKDCMTRHPIMISPETAAVEAQKIMSENKVRHLPVVGDGKKLLGLITTERLSLKPEMIGSLSVWEITRYLANLKVKSVMQTPSSINTIRSDQTVEEAAKCLAENKLSGLVVAENGNVVVGIITETDVMNAFQEMLGLPRPGMRVTLKMPNKVGEFAKLARVISDQNWGIGGIGTFPMPKDPDHYNVVLKISAAEDEIRHALGEIESQQIVDIRDVA